MSSEFRCITLSWHSASSIIIVVGLFTFSLMDFFDSQSPTVSESHYLTWEPTWPMDAWLLEMRGDHNPQDEQFWVASHHLPMVPEEMSPCYLTRQPTLTTVHLYAVFLLFFLTLFVLLTITYHTYIQVGCCLRRTQTKSEDCIFTWITSDTFFFFLFLHKNKMKIYTLYWHLFFSTLYLKFLC